MTDTVTAPTAPRTDDLICDAPYEVAVRVVRAAKPHRCDAHGYYGCRRDIQPGDLHLVVTAFRDRPERRRACTACCDWAWPMVPTEMDLAP